jgi:hypothetical protein
MGGGRMQVTLMEDDKGMVHLRNLSMHRANTEEDALNLLFLGDTNRTISETPMNMASSRSHCVFTVYVESRNEGSDKVRWRARCPVESSSASPPHRPREEGLTHPADPSRSNLAAALALLSRWRPSKRPGLYSQRRILSKSWEKVTSPTEL